MLKTFRPIESTRRTASAVAGLLSRSALGGAFVLFAATATHAQTSPAAAAQFLTLGASAAYAVQDSSGGSALAQITRAQGGIPDASLPLPASPSPVPASTAAFADLEPAALTTPPVLAQDAFAPTPTQLAVASPALLTSISPGPPPGRDPSIFGSVALAVDHSGLDGRWLHVAYAAAPDDARWRTAVHTAQALPERARLAMVNTWVNHAITFQSDMENYGVSDYWASARESLARGRGDCEDYAIAKMELLKASGVPARDLYLVIAKDLVRHADHALLVVRLDNGFWVLDSGFDEVLPASAVADYRPVLTFSAGREWMHGYRRAPDLVLASTSTLRPALGR